MKKTGLLIGIGFLAGAIFFALTFGFVQKNDKNEAVLSPTIVRAETESLGSADLASGSVNFVPIVKKVKPAVVQVNSRMLVEAPVFGNDDFFEFFGVPQPRQRREQIGYGSGFFISADGYILTNNHVVEKAVKVTVTSVDETEYTAKIIGTDPRTDLALLKVDVKNHPFIPLGDSTKVEVGEWVLAIGNPLQQAFSVTSGIISAEGRRLQISDDSLEDFLQTDAPINRGNSGGPLVNMNGEAIGINSIILSPSGGSIGIGFAIPSAMAKRVVTDLKEKGEVIRGWFGISIQYFNEKQAKEYEFSTAGAVVISVEENSPAERAGLKRDDIIIEIDGKAIKSGNELVNTIANAKPGDVLKVVLYRDDRRMTISVPVGKSPRSSSVRVQSGKSRSLDLGMSIEKNTPRLADEYGLKSGKGVVVTDVQRGGIAAENGLRPGDMIVQLNRTPINSVDQFEEFMSKRAPGTGVLMYIIRSGREYTIRFALPEE